MRGQSTLPMDVVDVELLSDIIEHFLGENRASANELQEQRETVADGFNPSYSNNDADLIIEDLERVEKRTEGRDLLVEDCTDYTPQSEAEASFLDLQVHGYVQMKRQYFEECHNPHQ